MSAPLFIYATNTGTTYTVGRYCQDYIAKHHQQLQLVQPHQLTTTAIEQAPYLILACGTWQRQVKGQVVGGQLHHLFQALIKSDLFHQLNDKKVAVCGLGDSRYQYYCGATILLEKAATKAGGHIIQPSLSLNTWPAIDQPSLMAWLKTLPLT